MALRAGIVGFGLAGRVFHAPLARAEGIEIAAVASSRRDEIRAALPDAVICDDAAALINRDDLDLVILATPTPTHAPLAIAALKAGKHVVVDKPFAASTAEAQVVFDAADAAGRQVTCFQNRRWDGDFLTLRALMDAGELGDIRQYHASFDFFKEAVTTTRWQDQTGPGVGIEYDLGTHLIDQALQLFGNPDWVEGEIWHQRPRAVVSDAMHLRMGFGPLRVTLSANYAAPDFKSKLLVQGSKGAYRKYHMDIQEPQLRSGMMPWEPGFGLEPEDHHGWVSDGAGQRRIETRPGDQAAFYRKVKRAIENDGPMPVTPRQIKSVLGVIGLLHRANAADPRRVFRPDQSH